ncbi:NAD-dependent epimerase/dehydratase family protein [Streptomyces sp. NPDC050560]|uniref:NAD-dependent epimerase/dehydratase family protein n=1 Tax=Streptomyces sp. NPDC050560 TaxID=3365630 RepID=UPI0037ADDA04
MSQNPGAAADGGTVLVTGAAGGIGRTTVAVLAAAGLTVVGADRRRGPGDDGCADFVVGDLTDPAVVAAAFDRAAAAGPGGPRGVVHLAAVPAPGIVSDQETVRTNVTSTYAVFHEAGARGVPRVVAASSAAAVGIAWAGRDLSPRYVPVDEEHPDLTVDAYGLTKVAAEGVAAYATRRWGTVTVLLRFPFVGAGERLRKRLADVCADPAANRRELWGWLHTEDAAGSVLAALTADVEGHHVVNVAAPDSATTVPTRDLLAAHHPTAELRAPLDGHASLFDTTRCRELLGFTPRRGWRGEAEPL